MAGWIRDETGIWFDPVTRKPNAYQSYVETMGDLSHQLRLRCDILEELIFRSAAQEEPALDPRRGWIADHVADDQAIERFRYHFHRRLPDVVVKALDGFRAEIASRPRDVEQ